MIVTNAKQGKTGDYFEIEWHVGVAVVNPKLSAGIKQLKARNKNPCAEVYIDEYGDLFPHQQEAMERMKIPMKKPDLKQEELEGWGSF